MGCEVGLRDSSSQSHPRPCFRGGAGKDGVCDQRTTAPTSLPGSSLRIRDVGAQRLGEASSCLCGILPEELSSESDTASAQPYSSRRNKRLASVRVVEVGQYFMTKDTGDFRQFRSVACREYTLPRDDRASQPKGWIQGNMRIGPVLEVTTSFQHFKYGIEIRIKSVNQDNSHSWVRISYGTVKYVNDSIEDDTENLADSQEEEGVPTSTSVVAARSKAKV